MLQLGCFNQISFEKRTYVTGTLRKDRKGNQKEVTAGKPKMFVNGKDKCDVLTISNTHTPQIITITNHLGKEKQKVNIVRDCNDSISGIDCSDQMLSYHSGLRKTLRWYKKAGVQILEIFIANVFCLYWKFSLLKELCHLVEFHKVIIKNLIGERKKKADGVKTTPDGVKKEKPTRRCWQCWKKEIRKES